MDMPLTEPVDSEDEYQPAPESIPPHSMETLLALEMVRVTEAAAVESARFMGRGDRHAADRAATEAMAAASVTLTISSARSCSTLSA